jgi:hypothetical protein|tara:strand:- start:371 stop:568 length:198 start_codon:yes stop_codon:yes gene_type:complete
MRQGINLTHFLFLSHEIKKSIPKKYIGKGEEKIETDEEIVAKIRERYEWARKALKIKVKVDKTQF